MYRTESEIKIRIGQLRKKRLTVLKESKELFLSHEEQAQIDLISDEIKWLTDHYNGLLSLGVVDTLMDEEGMFCE